MYNQIHSMRDIIFYTLMFSAMLQLLMAAYAWGRRNEPSAKPVIILFILSFVWAFGYGMEIASYGINTKLTWMKIYWTATSFGPFVFLLIVFSHLDMNHLLTPVRLSILTILSVIPILLMWTIPHHNLLLYDFTIENIASLDILQKKNGILFTPVFLALQGISLITYYYLIRSFSNANYLKRRQSITILFALLVPFIFNIPTILGISPIKGFDFTPHALVLSSGLFAFAIFRYRWLDLIPLASTKLVEVIPVGVIVLDATHRIVDINPSARRILNMTYSVIGQNAQTLFTDFNLIALASTQEIIAKEEIKIARDETSARYFDVHTVPLKNQENQFNGHIIMFHDMTERKQAESAIQNANQHLQKQLYEIEALHIQLHEQAIRDPLTKLFNRGYLNDTLERETHRAERHQHPMSVLMVEIDNFKIFNDNFGHEVGDVTLEKVAELIQANIRTDDIACRFGGDEFTVILPETPLESARQCAERLRESAVQMKLQHEGKLLGNLTLSIGVAVFPKHGNTVALILRAADEAMYRAKQNGKNKVMIANE